MAIYKTIKTLCPFAACNTTPFSVHSIKEVLLVCFYENSLLAH